MQISLNKYNQILEEIRSCIQEAKVKMCWEVGKILIQNQNSIDKSSISQLSIDLEISTATLYRMRSFYRAYQNGLPESKLTWSKLAILSEIKDPIQRNLLQQKAEKQGLTTADIKEEIKKDKSRDVKDAKDAVKKPVKLEKLYPNRGKLYCYKIGKPYPDSSICLDLGFSVFRQVKLLNIPKDLTDIVKITKNNDTYSAEKIEINSRSIHIYKGYLTRIVDGDTIRVSIDLGFGVFREEILRLRGVYAQEMGTVEGAKAKRYLERLFKDLKFVVLRTYQTDMYGRYVCDVFYASGENDAQKVANEGSYLNEQLVNQYSKIATPTY